MLPVHRALGCTELRMLLPPETHHPFPSPQPLQTVPRLTWWGTGSLDRGLRPSSGVVAMAAAAAMAEEAASGSMGSSGLCSCFTMTEHSLCPSTHAPCSMSGGRGQDPGSGDFQSRGLSPAPIPWELLCTGLRRDAGVYWEVGRKGQGVGGCLRGGRVEGAWAGVGASSSYSSSQSGLTQQTWTLLTGCVTLGKLLNLSEALNSSSVKVPEEK